MKKAMKESISCYRVSYLSYKIPLYKLNLSISITKQQQKFNFHNVQCKLIELSRRCCHLVTKLYSYFLIYIAIQGVLALCEFHQCEFHYCDFSKLSKNIWLMRFYTYLANAILELFLPNAILFAIYFVTAIIR